MTLLCILILSRHALQVHGHSVIYEAERIVKLPALIVDRAPKLFAGLFNGPAIPVEGLTGVL